MGTRIWNLLIVLTLVALPTVALAEAPNYKHIEVGYNDVDVDNLSDSGDGWFVGGMWGGKNWHAFGRYNSDDVGSVEREAWWLGAGWHGLLGEKADVVGEGAYVDSKTTLSAMPLSSSNSSDSGYFVRGGIRWRLVKFFELGGFVKYADVGADSDSGYEVNAIFYVWRINLGLGYEDLGEVQTANLFARFTFGK